MPLPSWLTYALTWLVRLLFRVRLYGLEHWPRASERVLIIANHSSPMDGVVLYLFLPGPLNFAVNERSLARPLVRALLRWVRWHAHDTLSPLGLKNTVHLIRAGERVVMFPEDRRSNTGTLMKVYAGPGLVADKADCQLLPVMIDGLEHAPGAAAGARLHRRWWPRVTLRVLPPRKLVLPPSAKGDARRELAAVQVLTVMQEIAFAAANLRATVFMALLHAGERHGMGSVVLEDARGARLSYRQIATRAFILASVIAARIPAGGRVGIMLPSTAAAVVTLMACLARGRVAAMLNFTAGARGLETAVETAAIALVITSRAFVEVAELAPEIAVLAQRAEIIYLEDLRDGIGLSTKLGGALCGRVPCTAHRWLCRNQDPEQAAVVLFTSGSEGIPKGVVLSHANLIANVAQVHMLIDLTRRDRVLNVLPVFHAFGLLGGVLLPLFKGCPTYQYPSPLHYRVVPELCYQLDVTCLFGTTTFLRGYARNAHPYDMRALRFVIAGAEKLTDDVRQAWADKFGVRIFEGYGATEASPVLAVNYPLANRRGTVGRLLVGIDHYLAPVEGIEDGGELVVRGPNVMQGYLFHGSDGTLIRPWTEERGAGWYATGDIVAIDSDGFVTIKGRAKRFAKIGGEMVSLAICEELATSLWPDGCHAALVLADMRKGEQIVLATNLASATRAALVAAARQHAVSELALPRQVIHLEDIPLLGSGKVNYPALRDLLTHHSAVN